MQQTFYIDVDEEISSVIDRLNKSMSGDNFFVVPKRAIFLQSIVNLKLLKREADKIGKRVTIITQDEVGTSMAERAGINVQPNLEGVEAVNESSAYSAGSEAETEYEDEEVDLEEAEKIVQKRQNIQNRLNNVGSEDFYDASEKSEEIPQKPLPKRMQVNSVRKTTKKEISAVPSQVPQTKVYKTIDTKRPPAMPPQDIYPKQQPKSPLKKQLDPYKEKTLEKMFSKPQNDFAKNNDTQNLQQKIRGGKVKKVLVIFMVVCLLLLLGVAAYLFIPSAKIIITPNILKDKIDVNIHGGSSVSANEPNIEVRTIDKEETLTLSYEVSGQNATSGKKAHGSVVIYNEYSSESQSLVATTRLETGDGKIFRLIKSAVVPGTSKVGGETKPGAIEVEVVADQAGSDYNIDPADFKIPGFKDGPKYDKFYAKSSKTMTGGTSEGSEQEGSAKINQSDIDNAKAKTESAIKDKLKQAISAELVGKEIVLPENEKITIKKSSVDARVGNVASSFNCTVVAAIHAIVFSQSDVENIIQKSQTVDADNFKKEISKVDYVTAQPDFDANSLELKVHGEIIETPIINADKIKNELLGKGSDQLGEILRKYSSIKNVNVEFQPSFISVIPQYSQRVSVEINNE